MIPPNPSSAAAGSLVHSNNTVSYNINTGGSELVPGPVGKFGTVTHTLGSGTGRPAPASPFSTIVPY